MSDDLDRLSIYAIRTLSMEAAQKTNSGRPGTAVVMAPVSIETGSTVGWERHVARKGARIGIESFGASAPAPDVYKNFDKTIEAIERAARVQAARAGDRT